MTFEDTSSESPLDQQKPVLVALVASAIAIHCSRQPNKKGPRAAIQRKRCVTESIIKELGPVYTRRAYRMPQEAFFALHAMLRPPFLRSSNRNRGCRHGVIPSTIHLAASLPFFAGGSPYDLAVMHGVSLSAVYESAWMVVDHAINQQPMFYPTFQFSVVACRMKSNTLLPVSLPKSLQQDLIAVLEQLMEFLCGLKSLVLSRTATLRNAARRNSTMDENKNGLNMMGTVDHVGRFIDVEIRHPGATSDYLCFETSTLKRKLNTPNFLAPNLVLFGDNAYVDSDCMVSPSKNPKIELGEDDFNFSIPRMDPGQPLEDDVVYNISQGGFELEETDGDATRPTALIGGGDHLMMSLAMFADDKHHHHAIIRITFTILL